MKTYNKKVKGKVKDGGSYGVYDTRTDVCMGTLYSFVEYKDYYAIMMYMRRNDIYEVDIMVDGHEYKVIRKKKD